MEKWAKTHAPAAKKSVVKLPKSEAGGTALPWKAGLGKTRQGNRGRTFAAGELQLCVARCCSLLLVTCGSSTCQDPVQHQGGEGLSLELHRETHFVKVRVNDAWFTGF